MAMRASAIRSRVTVCSATGSTERHALLGAPAHQLERTLGQADQAHAVVDAARAEAALGDLEAAALAEQHVAWPAPGRR